MSEPVGRAAMALGMVCLLSVFSVSASSAVDDAGPSFDCARVTSQINRTICASAELSALDRQLAGDYDATVHQAGIDGKTLQSDEARWLREVRNRCDTETCLKEAYRARDAAILDASLQAASPAAYDDTRPFPAPSGASIAARARLGTSCGGGPVEPLPGTSKVPGFRTVVARGGYVVPLIVDDYPFAFWMAQADAGSDECTVRDVVALPPTVVGNRFMQCHLGSDSHGFAVRSGKGKTLAYWSISDDSGRLRREPIHVIGEQDLHCQDPEAAE